MAAGNTNQTSSEPSTGRLTSPAPAADAPARPATRGSLTATLGRQIGVMLVAALLAGMTFIGVLSLVLLDDLRPWVPVQAANEARDQAGEAAEATAGTPEAAAALAALELAEARATDTAAQAREAVRTGLLVVAGLGGVWGLVVAYRRQQHLEHHERPQAEERAGRERTQLMTERFRVAAEQLGSSAPATRLAGVYAMAALADEWDEQQQQCINVLCAYLRIPWDPDNDTLGEVQVRLTVIAVMRDHLLPVAAQHWRTRNFDLRAATIPAFDWNGIALAGVVQFDGATFSGDAWFSGATLAGDAQFDGATFSGDAWFSGATLAGDAQFNGATFCSAAFFDGATFSVVARFNKATFCSDAWFVQATFCSDAPFDFDQPLVVSLPWEIPSEGAWFDEATFSASASFSMATFHRGASFVGATFSSYPDFDDDALSPDGAIGANTDTGGGLSLDTAYLDPTTTALLPRGSRMRPGDAETNE